MIVRVYFFIRKQVMRYINVLYLDAFEVLTSACVAVLLLLFNDSFICIFLDLQNFYCSMV